MINEKKFIAALKAAGSAKDLPKVTELMQERTKEHINRMHLEKISGLEAPCLIAAVMIHDKVYQSSYGADEVEFAKQIVDSVNIETIYFNTPAKAGDING